jgi:hypothetical protein
MRLSVAAALWLLTGVFAAITAAGLFWPPAKEAETAARPGQAENAAAPPGLEPIKVWTAAILAHPLFSPDRRPLAAANQPAGDTGRAELPRLSGILITPDGASAIFAGSPAERPVVAGKGTKIGPWEIVGIDAGQVRLLGPEGERTVQPRYANGASESLPPVVKPQAQPPLLPPLPQAAAQPFESLQQPSGASIFSHASLPPAPRTPK